MDRKRLIAIITAITLIIAGIGVGVWKTRHHDTAARATPTVQATTRRTTPKATPTATINPGDAAALAASLGNDLQEPALTLRPRLQQVLDLGAELGAAGAIVSGSGPTVALLARDAHHAAGLSQSLLARGHETIVTTSSHRGAHVLP